MQNIKMQQNISDKDRTITNTSDENMRTRHEEYSQAVSLCVYTIHHKVARFSPCDEWILIRVIWIKIVAI